MSQEKWMQQTFGRTVRDFKGKELSAIYTAFGCKDNMLLATVIGVDLCNGYLFFTLSSNVIALNGELLSVICPINTHELEWEAILKNGDKIPLQNVDIR